MCYYNGQKVAHGEFLRLKNIEKIITGIAFFDRPPYENDGFKYMNIAVCKRVEANEDFNITGMEWGFIPPYWKNREEVKKFREGFKDANGKWVQYLTLNAKSEEMLLPNKMYRDAALHRRCLIPTSGFVEAHHYFPANKRTGEPTKTPQRQPYHISFKDKPYAYMAGFWQQWTDKDTGETVDTTTIVTTTAIGHRIMEPVHNEKLRMPTILTEDLAWEWMFGDLAEKRITEIGGSQYPAELMQACPIERGYKESKNPFVEFKYENSPVLAL